MKRGLNTTASQLKFGQEVGPLLNLFSKYPDAVAASCEFVIQSIPAETQGYRKQADVIAKLSADSKTQEIAEKLMKQDFNAIYLAYLQMRASNLREKNKREEAAKEMLETQKQPEPPKPPEQQEPPAEFPPSNNYTVSQG